MMSLLVVAAIVLAVALGYTTKINIGLFAIAFASPVTNDDNNPNSSYLYLL